MRNFKSFFMLSLTKSQNTQRGASLTEYSLIVALIAVVAIAGIKFTGKSTRDSFCTAGVSVSREQKIKGFYSESLGKCCYTLPGEEEPWCSGGIGV